MRDFRSYIKECMEGEGSTLPAIEGEPDAGDLFNPTIREAVNYVLADIVDPDSVDSPVVVYDRVRSIMLELGFGIPPVSEKQELFSEPEGEDFIALTRPQPPEQEEEPAHCFLYFAFYQHEDGNYEAWAEIVTEEGMEDILFGDETSE